MRLTGPADEAASLVRQTEIREAAERVEAVRKKKRRHGLWALLGISPAAMLPAIGLLLEGSLGLLVLLGFLVTGTQGYAWMKSMKEEEEAEEALRRLLGES
jgi:hypothetical protein